MRLFSSRAATAGAILALGVAPRPTGTQPQATRAGEFVVVVNNANPVNSIARDQLSRLFLKRIATWPDGKAAEPVDLPTTDLARIAFTKSIHGKSVGAVRAFWQQQIFSGRDVPPPEKASSADVIDFVSTHVGAVGYVPATQPLGAAVKTLAIEGNAP